MDGHHVWLLTTLKQSQSVNAADALLSFGTGLSSMTTFSEATAAQPFTLGVNIISAYLSLSYRCTLSFSLSIFLYLSRSHSHQSGAAADTMRGMEMNQSLFLCSADTRGARRLTQGEPQSAFYASTPSRGSVGELRQRVTPFSQVRGAGKPWGNQREGRRKMRLEVRNKGGNREEGKLMKWRER